MVKNGREQKVKMRKYKGTEFFRSFVVVEKIQNPSYWYYRGNEQRKGEEKNAGIN